MSHLPFILLVDDNQDDYEAMMRSFRKNHLVNPVHWCRSGAEARRRWIICAKKVNMPTIQIC